MFAARLFFLTSLLVLQSIILPSSAVSNQVTGFSLINADSNTPISTLGNNDVVNLALLPTRNLNIQAHTDPSTVDSVAISLQGATSVSRTEGVAPYALFGDSNGSFHSGSFNTGIHTLSATPTHNAATGAPHTISFSVIDAVSTEPVADAGKDRYIFPPQDNITLKGNGVDADGTVTDYHWTQLAGPTGAVLSGKETNNLTVSSLVEGSYTMRLTVTDNDGKKGYDDVVIKVYGTAQSPGAPSPSGELRTWHKITITFDGPSTSENDTLNPFTDYRFNVTFINGDVSYTVPGYFAADGNAGNSGASKGDKWRVHFAPDRTGTWYYVASFRSGTGIAGSADPGAGSAVSSVDGLVGNFAIGPTNKGGRDFRGKGRLQYNGGRYLQFAGSGEYFLKQGADAPENFLAYDGFDNTPDYGGRRKSWSSHEQDWKSGDPTWKGGKGKGIIGAINYLASEGMNAFSFIPMNIGGDDRNVFPYISDSPADRTRMDCSKLDQWEMVFEHADRRGMFLHFKTQETENELLLDNGNLGLERKVYYRELIARYSHHLALNWNLGEEINNASTAQKKSWAQYFYDTDPYNHHIVIHNGSSHYDLLGPGSKLTGFSLQTSNEDFSAVHDRVRNYLSRAADAGKTWAVACDEPGDASHALRPDNDAGSSHMDGRKNGLWGSLMAGGWGNEWYFGYRHDHSDLTCENFRSRDRWWDFCRYALNFFTGNGVPFWKMVNNNAISSNTDDYCLLDRGSTYVVYLKNGGRTSLDLRGEKGDFRVRWYNPRTGGSLINGTVKSVPGGGWADLGLPPTNPFQDWAILVSKGGEAGRPTTAPILILLQ